MSRANQQKSNFSPVLHKLLCHLKLAVVMLSLFEFFSSECAISFESNPEYFVRESTEMLSGT